MPDQPTTDRSAPQHRPGAPVPGPRPGTPIPGPKPGASVAARPKPVAHKPKPVDRVQVVSDPSRFGRVDDDGSVWLTTADGERQIGNWQAGNAEEGLAHFGRRYDDLATEIELLEARLTSGSGDAKKTKAAAQALLDGLPDAAVIGDIPALVRRLTAVLEHSEQASETARKQRDERRATALTRKRALCEEAEEIGENSTAWKAAGDRLRDILTEWKSVRGLDRNADDELWKRYSKARENFNRRRGTHFADLDKERAEAKARKEDLVVRARELSSSTEWSGTSAVFRQLLVEWKAAGRAPRDTDDALWHEFKSAQDVFFAARAAAAAERDTEFLENAIAKEALLTEAEAITIDSDQDLDTARGALRAIQDQWEEIGKVPRERMQELESRLRAVEKRVRDAAESQWRRTDPEALARVAQFRERAEHFAEQASKFAAAGKDRDARKAQEQADQWSQWAAQAAEAVEAGTD